MTLLERAGVLAGLVLAACAAPSWAQSPATATRPAPAASSPAQPSALTAELFYQLLLAELTARGNDAGAAFSLVLDAARRTGDPALYQRAVDIALQARAGDSALQAARAWKQAQPASREANRYVLQILLALNRIPESLEPLKSEIATTPVPERPVVLSLIPRLYGRASDKRQAAAIVEQGVAEALARPETAAPAWVAVGRVRLAAGDESGAMEAARRAQAADASAEGPVLLALELMAAGRPQAEELVRRHLDGKAQPELRMAYARALLDAGRLSDARQQLQRVTTDKPELAEPWLMAGVLQVQDNQLDAGEASLKRYVQLAADQQRASGEDAGRGLSQAFLALAQAAEKRGNLQMANAWLDRISSPADLAAAQQRRASILARQGRLDEARKLLRELPERNPEEARTKLMAEAQLLRDNKRYQEAHDLLAAATRRGEPDADLLYEQAMMAEKLDRLPEMERLLRQSIALKPDSAQAYNALGYSLADRNIRLPEAKQLIQKALSLAPGDPFITDSLAWVEFRMGNKAEAQRLLEQAYRARPDAEIAAHLGEVLWSLGLRERAQAIWKEGLLLDRENQTLQDTLRRLKVQP